MAQHIFGEPLSEADHQMLASCGILRQHAEDMCRRVDLVTGAEMFGQNGIGDCAGIVFLIRWPGVDQVREYLLRKDSAPVENGKTQRKYLWPSGRGNILLFPPRAAPEWLDDSSLPVVFAEGPKKLLALWNLAWHNLPESAERPRFLPIAVSGVWNFRGRIGKVTNEHGERVDEKGLIPDFSRVKFTGRETTIWYDRNVHDNPDKSGSVSHARNSFAKELRLLGANVRFCDLPADDLTINGPDDYAGKYGIEAALELYSRRYDPKTAKAGDKKAPTAEQPLKCPIDQLPSVQSFCAQEVKFLIPGLIPEGTISVISGESMAGKTTLALYFSKVISTGAAVLGGQCEHREVLFLTRENPVSYMSDICKRFAIENGSGSNLMIWGDWNDDLPPRPDSPNIQKWIKERKSPPLVVIDSFISFFDGRSENDAAEVRAFIDQGRKPLRAGAGAIIFLHHPGKASTAKDYRGSSDIKAAIDSGYTLSNTGEVKLERLLLKAFKARFATQKRELALDYSEENGVAFFKSDERPTAVRETVTAQLTKLLRENPACTSTEFEKAAMARNFTQADARRFLRNGIEAGKVLVEKGTKNKKLHSLASLSTANEEAGTIQ